MCADAFGYILTRRRNASAGIMAMVLSTDARATMSGCIEVGCFAPCVIVEGGPGSLRLNAGGGS